MIPLALTKSWKPIVAIASAALVFAAGWQVNGWRLKNEMRKNELALARAYEARRSELLAEYERQAAADEAARLALSRNLEDARTRTALLEEELERTRLTPNPAAVRVERVLVPGDCANDQPEVVLANPFTADFVRLWNQSASDFGATDAPTQ